MNREMREKRESVRGTMRDVDMSRGRHSFDDVSNQSTKCFRDFRVFRG